MKHRGGMRPAAAALLAGWIVLMILGTAAVAAEEGRCSWFTRFEWNTRQGIVDEIDNLEACHTNAIMFQIRGEADAFYISEHEPWSRLLGDEYPGYDPLAVAIYEAHRRGMELHAYVNAMPAWGSSSTPASPDHIYRAHPEWIMAVSYTHLTLPTN